VALEAIDSDVIITYVRLGLGVGIVAESAVAATLPNERADPGLVVRPLGHLFGSNLARVAFKRGAWLRRYVIAFAELLSPRLSQALIERAMRGDGTDYKL
jgi:LysR family cys regulon transcriptional activator